MVFDAVTACMLTDASNWLLIESVTGVSCSRSDIGGFGNFFLRLKIVRGFKAGSSLVVLW